MSARASSRVDYYGMKNEGDEDDDLFCPPEPLVVCITTYEARARQYVCTYVWFGPKPTGVRNGLTRKVLSSIVRRRMSREIYS